MKKVLVTDAVGFLGYHVTKQLNEKGITPLAMVPKVTESTSKILQRLDVELVEGSVTDYPSLETTFKGLDTVIHLEFLISGGGGSEIRQRLFNANVKGTHRVLDAAKAAKVKCVVLSSSVLAVGVNHEPQPLDESAEWEPNSIDLEYALSRRQAEQEALARSNNDLKIVVASPSLTMGPEDFVGAPANRILKLASTGRLPVCLPIGFGCLDVRDFAAGVLAAAEHGRGGQRYILSSHNVTMNQFLAEAADIAGVRPPRWTFPRWLAYFLITLLQAWGWIKKKPAPVSHSILQLWNRYAWYDAHLAHEELGWQPQPLRDSIEDSIRWMRENNDSK